VALEIRLLGRPGVRRDGVTVAAPRGHKVWGLLAYLVLNDRPVARTRAAALLFPEANDPLAAVRWNLHELRRLLGPDCALRGDPIGVRLPPGSVLDVTVLRSGLWREALLMADPDAELLQGLGFPGCAGFEAWLAAERRHLHSVAEEVLHESVLARLATGQIHEAVATASRLVGSNPYNEGWQELYIRSLLATGDDVGARRQRQAAIELLRRDLGVAPGPGLATLCRRPIDDDVRADATRIKAWSNLGLTWVHAGSYDAGLANLRRAVTAARRNHDPTLLLRSLLCLGYGLGISSLGGGAESLTVEHEAIALATELGDHRALGIAEVQFAMTEMLRGQYSRAVHWADLAGTRCAGDPLQAARSRTIRGTAAVDTGHTAEGIEELEAALDSAPVDADPHQSAYALSMLGKAHLLRGDLAAAIPALDRAIGLARLHWVGFRPWPEALRAEVALALGQVQHAEHMFQAAYALARSFDHSPCWESATARGLGLVASAHGAVDRAVARLDDAYRSLDRESATYQWARCNALDSLCEVAVTNHLPGSAGWLAELEEQAGRFRLQGFLARSFQYRDRLGLAGTATLAALPVAPRIGEVRPADPVTLR
jgi:DNA-binding SARP family transcriptional activator